MLQVVLTKNGYAKPDEREAAKRLFAAVATAEHVTDILPLLFSHCRKNIEKRLRKMLQAVDAFSHDLDRILKSYAAVVVLKHKSLAIEAEFPKAASHLRSTYSAQGVPEMMRMLLADIKTTAKAVHSSRDIYIRLVTSITALQDSRLLHILLKDGRPRSVRRKLAEGLNRRLTKVSQYYYSVNHLIKEDVKRYFPSGNINHHWVDNIIADTGETILELTSNPCGAISYAVGEYRVGETVAKLGKVFPNMEEMWFNHRIVNTRLHAEVRIVLHLGDPFSQQEEGTERPIGCNKRSCLCCALWITAYNQMFDAQWLTSGGPTANPTRRGLSLVPSYEHAYVSDDGKKKVDEAVLHGVLMRLTDCLDWSPLQGEEERASDEYQSSDSDTIPEAVNLLGVSDGSSSVPKLT